VKCSTPNCQVKYDSVKKQRTLYASHLCVPTDRKYNPYRNTGLVTLSSPVAPAHSIPGSVMLP